MLRVLLVAACMVLPASSVYSQTTDQYDADVLAQAQAEMQTILGFVEGALSKPMPDLKASAEHGKLSDKLVYGLALKAGRMGAEGARDAKKWIKRSRISNESAVPSGPAFVPAYTPSNFSGGKTMLGLSKSTVISGENPQPGFSTQITMLDPVWIKMATACIDALQAEPKAPVDMSVCGGEASYLRLHALLPDPGK